MTPEINLNQLNKPITGSPKIITPISSGNTNSFSPDAHGAVRNTCSSISALDGSPVVIAAASTPQNIGSGIAIVSSVDTCSSNGSSNFSSDEASSSPKSTDSHTVQGFPFETISGDSVFNQEMDGIINLENNRKNDKKNKNENDKRSSSGKAAKSTASPVEISVRTVTPTSSPKERGDVKMNTKQILKQYFNIKYDPKNPKHRNFTADVFEKMEWKDRKGMIGFFRYWASSNGKYLVNDSRYRGGKQFRIRCKGCETFSIIGRERYSKILSKPNRSFQLHVAHSNLEHCNCTFDDNYSGSISSSRSVENEKIFNGSLLSDDIMRSSMQELLAAAEIADLAASTSAFTLPSSISPRKKQRLIDVV